MNLSGGGVAAHAPNRENAILFLEYLASDQAQQYFSNGNDEYPSVEGVQLGDAVASLGEFTADDFLKQIRQMKKLGSMESLMKMLPGMGGMMKQMKNMSPPDEEVKKIEAIICSMTMEERNDCRIVNGSRKVRIAKGSGTRVQDVNKFVKQFEEAKKMMTGMMKMGMGKGLPGMDGGFKFPF